MVDDFSNNECLIGKVGLFITKLCRRCDLVCGTVVSVHLYFSKDGVKSVKLHLRGINGYYRLQDCVEWL